MKYETQKIRYKGENNPFYGKKHTIKTKRNIAKSRIGKSTGSGKYHWNWKGGITLKNLIERKPCLVCGKSIWLKSTYCYHCAKLGKRHPFWQGGITKEKVKIWRSKEYQQWRKSIFKRDNYTCQNCGKTNCWIEAHHIKEFAKYPKYRFIVKNGITLCRSCHHNNQVLAKYK